MDDSEEEEEESDDLFESKEAEIFEFPGNKKEEKRRMKAERQKAREAKLEERKRQKTTEEERKPVISPGKSLPDWLRKK